ncbi:MAG: 4-hydroxythreonine-4-phosphate dehydrogenase PdxA [Geminicoccaceae bacterium]
MARHRLALTMGDPAGIGPEIVLKAIDAVRNRGGDSAPELIVVGSAELLADEAARLGLELAVEVVEAGRRPGGGLVSGVAGAEGGRLAYLAVARAVELALAGQVDAIVTAPLNKAALNMAGYDYPGHTELLAKLTDRTGTVLMLAHGAFRVTHVTTHVALECVPSLVTEARVRRVLELTLAALRRLGMAAPRVAVAALNPHAGEGGIFGRNDLEVTAPLVAEFRARGEAVEGPIPGDTVFVNLRAGRYDAVVAMYHDQGLIPVKYMGVERGVNVTLGLPLVRTSPDHGTAFDIAGTGQADAGSLLEAIRVAKRLAGA